MLIKISFKTLIMNLFLILRKKDDNHAETCKDCSVFTELCRNVTLSQKVFDKVFNFSTLWITLCTLYTLVIQSLFQL